MELVAYLTASVIISWYLDKKSKIGNVAFSILFTVILGFYVVISETIASFFPAGNEFARVLAELRESVDASCGVASAGQVVRTTMFVVAAGTGAYFLYQILAFVNRFFVKHLAKVFIRPSVTCGLPAYPLPLSSNVVAPQGPIAQSRIYIEFGVLRN